jgi:phosphopantothenoylcysteine synthetase/decarboxylase
MRILVTAGNTMVPIDRVRYLSNIFTGRTGTRIALCAHEHGHEVHLLTSHPEVVGDLAGTQRWNIQAYRTFLDLERNLEDSLRSADLDAIIHCAAVSDYGAGGIYAPAPGTRFQLESGRWMTDDHAAPTLLDRQAGKVKSDEPELWLRLVRTPKLIDRIRSDWNFEGILVKFKLEVGITDERLLEIAEQSRLHSHADLMVANTLEGSESWAYVGPLAGQYKQVPRAELPGQLISAVESKVKSQKSKVKKQDNGS